MRWRRSSLYGVAYLRSQCERWMITRVGRGWFILFQAGDAGWLNLGRHLHLADAAREAERRANAR